MSISKKTKTDLISAHINKYLTARNIDQHQPKLQVGLTRFNQEFGSVTFYGADPDLLYIEPPENAKRKSSEKVINNASNYRIPVFYQNCAIRGF